MKKINQWIDARKLKEILSIKSDFSGWTKRIIQNEQLIERKDFYFENEEVQLGKNKISKRNCFFTIEATGKIISNCKRSKIAQKIRGDLERGEPLDLILEGINTEKKQEMKIIKINDAEYPEQLRKIPKPPKQIYVKGNIQNLKEPGIAVIGTRYCSDYGRRVGKIFTKNLVGYNLNIISGLAIGIDRCAHKACVEAKGKTIAVLPSGFNNIFPKENEPLLNQILERGGTVITEYPPEFKKTSESCRERNRIVSGLAIATLVVEAGMYTGTSITVRLTREQNKKAFCIPSSLLNSKGKGTNQMIKENKAQLVTSVEDIIKELPELKLEKKADFQILEMNNSKITKTKKVSPKNNIQIEEENIEIYNLLTKGAKGIDEITRSLKRPIDEITYKLTLLELQGAIEELPGKRFRIKKG